MTNQLYVPEEGSHWYSVDGTPTHHVPNASKPGEFRRTTKRDAKRLGLVPSVTVKLRVVNKPAVNAYLINQHLISALTLTPGVGETSDSFVKRVLQDARVHGTAAADMGTRIHDFMAHQLDPDYPLPELLIGDYIVTNGVGNWLIDNPINAESVERNIASTNLFVGGRLDIIGEIPTLDVPLSIIDIKTQDILQHKVDKKTGLHVFNHYPEHKYQLAGYAALDAEVRGVQLPTACIYIARDVPGQIEVVKYKPGEGYSQFLACSVLWRDIYWDSDFDEEE